MARSSLPRAPEALAQRRAPAAITRSLNASNSNGGFVASLQVTNGNLYALAKRSAHYYIRFDGT